jgi:nucleoredoxin
MCTRLISRALLLAILASSSLPAAVEKWTNLDGQTMQAEFIGRKGDYVSFKKEDGTRYLYPYAKLNTADQARVDVLVEDKPSADLAADLSNPSAPAATTSAVARPGELAEALAGKLVTIKGKSLASAPRDRLNDAKFIAFYYSAHWCPPCRGFTPELVTAYKEIKAKHPEFEIVFVSSDKDADAMAGYMSEYNMTWPALRLDQKKTAKAVRRPSNERGIPNLVFMDADGKELSLSFTSSGDYLGPQKVLYDIKKHFDML